MKKIVFLALLLNVMVFAHVSAAETPPAKEGKVKEEFPGDWSDIVENNIGKFTSYRKSYIGYSLYNDDDHDKGQLKFQFSFKYQLIGKPKKVKKKNASDENKQKDASDNENQKIASDKEDRKWFNNFYLGYTQKSIWSIQKLSKPFKENNYSPELFYIYDNTQHDNMLKYVILGIFRHESTGESGAGSHGWNINYVEPLFGLGENVVVSTKLWIPAFLTSKNSAFEDPNMLDFYGYGELSAKWRFWKTSQLSTMFRHGTRRGKYAVETQLDLDLNVFGLENDYFNPTLFVQAWRGYGETLKTFNKNTTDIVIGISAIQ
jgi:outer membrane phospholipase A